MKLLQFLLSLCATFIGLVFALGQVGIDLDIDLTLYHYLLFALGLVCLFLMPYGSQEKKEMVLETDKMWVDKKVVHQLFQDYMEDDEQLTLRQTTVEKQKDELFIKVYVTVVKWNDWNASEKTEELIEEFSRRMKTFLLEETLYRFQIIYEAEVTK